MTVEEAANRLEAIARSRTAQAAVGEMVERVEIANRLEAASGLTGLNALATEPPDGALSGASVVHTLKAMEQASGATEALDQGAEN